MNDTTDEKRLRKSRTDRMLDGVCGGIGAYFGIDATLVRVGFVLLTFFGGAGILLYLAGMILMPIEPFTMPTEPYVKPKRDSSKFWGFLLIGLGIFWLLGNIGVSFWHGWWGMDWQVVIAVLFVLAGVLLLLGRRAAVPVPAAPPVDMVTADGPSTAVPPPPPSPRKLFKSRRDRKLFGVCGGLADHFGVDPTLVRLIFVLTVFASHGIAILAYFLLAILVPDEVVVPRAV
jgi:phage shock protein C